MIINVLIENSCVFSYLSGYMVTAVTVTVLSQFVYIFGGLKKL